MDEQDRAFSGSIPELYDTHMVPMIFAPYAADIARRVAADTPARVLELAAGSGVVPRALAPLLGPDARYVVTDLNQPMLDWARRRQPDDSRITWQQADALDLPFDAASFDAVCCQFGVMFFPDRGAGYRSARRVLRPGGRFVFSVWDKVADNEFAEVVGAALAELFPSDPPRFMERIPHGYHDIGLIRDDLSAAGFSAIAVETIPQSSTAASARHAAIAYCQGTPWRAEIEARRPGGLDEATEVAAEALRTAFGDGPITGRIQAHVISCRA